MLKNPLDAQVSNPKPFRPDRRTNAAASTRKPVAHKLARPCTAFVALVGGLTGQAANLIGGTPDTSNWPHPAAPTGNPYPRSSAGAAAIAQRRQIEQLGKALFWDEQVSSDNTVACGTCHMPRFGGTDGRAVPLQGNGNRGSHGVIPQSLSTSGTVDYGFASSSSINRSVTPVAAPSMIGAYLFRQLFWDLSAGPVFADVNGTPLPNFSADAALEALAVRPPMNVVEMGHVGTSWTFLSAKLAQSYPLALAVAGTIPPDIAWIMAMNARYDSVFNTVFANHAQFGGTVGVTRERFALAIAHYQRTLIPDQAPIDLGTMTANQISGFNVMKTRAGGGGSCFVCHSASGNPTLSGAGKLIDPFDNLFSDGRLQTIGISNDGNQPQPPRKTATLRNLGLHTKFFSAGRSMTPAQLIDSYHGTRSTSFGIPRAEVNFSPPLTDQEHGDVLDFLFNALTDPRVTNELPPFDRPTLRSEVNAFEANEYGTGTPPSGSSTVPEIIANAPPVVPKSGAGSWFKVGVGRVESGATTVAMLSLLPASGPLVWVGSPTFYAYGTIATSQGIATHHPSTPLDAGAIGLTLHVQWMVSGSSGLAYSDAATLVPFQ